MSGKTTTTAPAATGSDDPTKTPGTTPEPTEDPDGSTPTPEGDQDPTQTDGSDTDAALLEALARAKRLEAELEAERGKKEKAVEESKARKQRLQELRDRHGDTDGEVEELRQDIATKDDQIADLKNRLNSADEELKEFRAEKERTRLGLLAKLPEADRTEFDDPDVFPPARLAKIVDRLTTKGTARTTQAEAPAGDNPAGDAPQSIGDAIREEYRARGVNLK